MRKSIFQSVLTLLLLLIVSNYAKSQSVIALPVPEEGTNYCTQLKSDQKVKKLIAEINLYLKDKGHSVPKLQFVLRKMQQSGACNTPTQSEIPMLIAKSSGVKYYLLITPTVDRKQIGNEVNLDIEVFETATGEIVNVVSAASGRFNSDNIPFLTRKAFLKGYKELKGNFVDDTEIVENDTKIKDLKSDVDINIPVTGISKPNAYALIIGNEDYSGNQTGLNSEVNVEFAAHDARIFKEYAIKTLGIPEENITLLIDAKALEMDGAFQKMNSLAKVNKGDAELIFYYAGHGFPDEVTKEPYLIPVDVSATNLKYAIKLKDVYSKLTEFKTKRVTIFLDACFSGGARNQGLLAARAVKIKPKKAMLNGEVVVFTSSSGEQSSLPYKEKKHGLFTYYLLKYFQIYRVDKPYLDISEYLAKEIGKQSIIVNGKEQNPQTNVSLEAEERWKEWKFIDF